MQASHDLIAAPAAASAKGAANSNRPVNYVFVDYENVRSVDPALIGSKTLYFTLLLGPQCKLDGEVVEKILDHAASVQLVRLKSPGRNAVDFALALYLGKAINADPTAYFHIVSGDKGFEPMIEHLEARHIRVYRHDDCSKLRFTSVPKTESIARSTEELLSLVVERLQVSADRPKRKQRLKNWLLTLCGRSTPAMQIDELIDRLCKGGHVIIGEKEAVTYPGNDG
jgi:hypothetical protein